MKNSLQNRIRMVSAWLFLLLVTSAVVNAQSLSVKGKVTNEKSEAIPNLSITVKGTTKGTTTDENGNYLLSVPSNNSVLVFSSIGFETQEVNVNGQSTVNVVLSTHSQAQRYTTAC